MRTPDHIMYNTVDQRYLTKPPTSSKYMSHESLRRDEREGVAFDDREKHDILEAREAAEAAKPFMDVAVELHQTQEEVVGTDEITHENKALIEYAEQRARFAAEKGEARDLSDTEQEVLDVYKAQAQAVNVRVELGDDFWNMGPEEIISAAIEAEDRRKQATTREEKHKLADMERKLDNYARFLKSGEDDQYAEFSTDTTQASYLLGRMDVATGETTEYDGKSVNHNKLLIQARNLRSEAEMLRFVGNHMKLEEQKQFIAGHKTRS